MGDEPDNRIHKQILKNSDSILRYLKRIANRADWCRRPEMLSDTIELPISYVFEAEKLVQSIYKNQEVVEEEKTSKT